MIDHSLTDGCEHNETVFKTKG